MIKTDPYFIQPQNGDLPNFCSTTDDEGSSPRLANLTGLRTRFAWRSACSQTLVALHMTCISTSFQTWADRWSLLSIHDMRRRLPPGHASPVGSALACKWSFESRGYQSDFTLAACNWLLQLISSELACDLHFFVCGTNKFFFLSDLVQRSLCECLMQGKAHNKSTRKFLVHQTSRAVESHDLERTRAQQQIVYNWEQSTNFNSQNFLG